MPQSTLDVFLIHQAYLEGYKNGLSEQNDTVFEEVTAAISLMLAKLGIERLSDLSKRDYGKFIASVNKVLAEMFGRHPGFTMAVLQDFIKEETRVYGYVFGAVSAFRSLPPLNGDKLVTDTVNAPVAGLGETMGSLVTGTVAGVLADVRKTLTRAYADKLTLAETMRLIVGNRSLKYKDGLIPKLARRVITAADTAIQHGSAYLGHRLGSLVADNYQWVSVLDSGTTDICRSRNGNIYSYATGPRPPAHYRCRSTTVPVLSTVPTPVPTYFAWLRNQPTAILIDILGAERANAMERGNLRAEDLGSFGGVRPLTLADYRARVKTATGK